MSEQTAHKIAPEILAYMRKTSGMSEEDIAKKLKISTSKYLNIENGKESLSQKQLLHLADLYKRPLIAFQAIDIASSSDLPHDYRINRDKKLSSEVFLAKRKALYLAEELKEATGRKTILPKINVNLSVEELVIKIKDVIKIDYSFIRSLKTEPVISYYKSIIEEHFFIPVIEHPLKSSGVRAFSVYDEICVIVLNEGDSNEVRSFSLFHELCHLLKRQDGICTADILKDNANQPEERYCDKFAALILLPDKLLETEFSLPNHDIPKQITFISKMFGVSKIVTLIRLKELNLISPSNFKSIKKDLESIQKPGFGRRNWEQTYIKRTSRLVLNNLISSYRKGDLTYTSLSSITGIKDKYLQKLI